MIKVAKSAGFCFGVKLAIENAYEVINNIDGEIYTYGQLIHNKTVTNKLYNLGVKCEESINKIPENSTVIIRAHGVGESSYDYFQSKSIKIIDLTCPYVKKIHRIVKEQNDKNNRIIIVGNKNHPEVIGINGWCNDKATIINNENDINLIEKTEKTVVLVAQTTYNIRKWEKIYENVKKKFANVVKFDTICSATQKRQIETAELSKKVDIMIIIGGKNSSNTNKLFEISKENCEMTYQIEEAKDLPSLNIFNKIIIGITAGASTPPEVIKEVTRKMDEMTNKQDLTTNEVETEETKAIETEAVETEAVETEAVETKAVETEAVETEAVETKAIETEAVETEAVETEAVETKAVETETVETEVVDAEEEVEKSFSEALAEESVVTLRSGGIVTGKVIGYNTSEVFVDLGYKSDGVIQMEEFLNDPDFDPETQLEKGKEIEVFITRVNDGEGNVSLSKKRVERMRGMKDVENSYKEKTPIDAKVTEIVKGGIIAESKGVRIFVPASQVNDTFVRDLTKYKGETITVLITEFSKNRRKIVGSRRVLVEAEKNKQLEKFWGNIEIGKEYNGKVKSMTNFGVFIDLGPVDGLVHISELSWVKINHPSEVVKVGEDIAVSVLKYDQESQKISLGYRKAENNPWHNIEKKYTKGDEVSGKIIRLVPFGAFVEIEAGVEGLVHISQISNVRLTKPEEVLSVGQEVNMKVTEVDGELKKISLSIKEIQAIDPVREEQPVKKPVSKRKPSKNNSAPAKHTEEMTNTIGDALKGFTVETDEETESE